MAIPEVSPSPTDKYSAAALEALALVPVEEAARILGRSHWSLRYDVRIGRLRPVRFGGRLFFERSELVRMIERARRGK